MSIDLLKEESILVWKNLKKLGYNSPYIEVKNAGHKGLGVFAKTDILDNCIIEYCHSIILDTLIVNLQDDKLRQYTYSFDCQETKQTIPILPLGFGMIYNSADKAEEANAKYSTIESEKLVIYKSNRKIYKGEEILLWWGEKYYDWWIAKKESTK